MKKTNNLETKIKVGDSINKKISNSIDEKIKIKKISSINNNDNDNLPDEEYEVSFCCGGRSTKCDKDLLNFLAKTCVSGSVLTFCFFSLMRNIGDSAFLSSTISLILGTYLGSQTNSSMNKKKE